ncbi:MAG: alpha/beta hydrolase [Actinobacteria bacterium]|nr:alpha/beta hydrolase [Actinomycetota bacterium]
MGDYADLDGVRIHYEQSGAGEPLVLLHGGFGGVFVWQAQVPELSERYRVLVPEMRGRGRGHTPDPEGPITYQVQADDMIAFLEGTVGGPAHLVGGSDGGIIGLLVALQRPDLLRKLVTIGSNFNAQGLLEVSMWMEGSPHDDVWAGPRQRYEAVSPDGPDHWPVVFEKLQRMWRDGQPTLEPRDLSGIQVPVLVMAGDDDVVAHGHTIELYEALPLGQLAVIPGASHAVFMEKSNILNRLILDFLAEEGPPQTILPVRRAATAS